MIEPRVWLQSIALSILLAAGCLAANPLRTPTGAVEMDMYLAYESVTDGGIAGCANVSFSHGEIINNHMLWPWSGLKSLARQVYEDYVVQSAMNMKTLRYTDKRRLEETDDDPLAEGATCSARRMLLNELSFSESVCSCLSGLEKDTYCKLLDSFALRVHCHDQMAAHMAHRKDEFCPLLLSASKGVEYSQMCSGWLAGQISSLDLDLFALNTPSTPSEVDGGIASQEVRAYYLAWKAVEKLTKWADAHLFCKDEDNPSPTLSDIEILPTYESKFYLYANGGTARRIPLVVVAERNTDHTLIVVRNIRTTLEARLFLFNSLGQQKFIFPNGRTHRGYDIVARQAFANLARYMSGVVARTAVHPRVTVVGHGNFGGGIAAVLTKMLLETYPQNAAKIQIGYNMIVLEGGPVGDFSFNEVLRKANVRNVVSDMSGFVNMPCKEVLQCGETAKVPTGVAGERAGPFLALPGRVTVDSKSFSDDVWRVDTSKLEVVAHMGCSTSCWLSTKYCPDEPKPMCSTSSCPGFFTDEALNSNNI